MKQLLLSFCLLLSLLACSFSKAPVITVQNDSSVKITSITLKGTGFSKMIPILKPGKAISVIVHPQGESGLGIQFETHEGQKKKNDLAYIEPSGSYTVTIRISKSFEVTSKSDLRT